MEYPKQTLTELQKVFSDTIKDEKDLQQSYKIIYLEKVKQYKDKIRIYFFDRPNGQCTARSISFFKPEQLKMFIQECVNAYMFIKEQRVNDEIQILMPEYRVNILLPDLLKEIKEEQLKRWRNGK